MATTLIRLLPALAALSLAAAVNYDGFALYKLRPAQESHLRLIQDLIEESRAQPLRNIDVWREPTKSGKSVEILVSPTFAAEFEARLAPVNFTISIANIQEVIDREAATNAGVRASEGVRNVTLDDRFSWGRVMRDFAPSSRSFSFSRYQSLAEIQAYMRHLKSEHPNIVQLTSIGEGHEGNQLLVMQVASSVGRVQDKPSMWVDGGIHAREWVSPASVLYFITQLVEGYDSDAEIRNYVDNMIWYFLPVMNPDGYDHSHKSDRFWRKNRRPLPDGYRSSRWGCDLGVDLNRNFDWHHCGLGASSQPCSEIYCGSEAFSEPESRAVSSYVRKLKKSRNLQAFLTIHSFSQIWMYPYGHAKRVYAKNVAELRSLALKATRELERVHGTKYEVGTAADTLYEAAGGSDDWAHGKADIRYVYLIELRPCDDCSAGFMLPANQIQATGEETWAAVKVVADKILSDKATKKSKRPSTKRRPNRRRGSRIRVVRPWLKEDQTGSRKKSG